MDCTVIILAGGQGLRMGGLGQLMAKTTLVAYDWPLLIRALHQLGEHGFSKVLISTNSAFYTQLTTLVASYTNAELSQFLPTLTDIQVILNAEHDKGPLPALAEALKYVNTRRCLLYLADIFQVDNSLAAFAAVVEDDVDYLGTAIPFEAREMKRGGLVYVNGQEVTAIVERPDEHASSDALRWNGIALFNHQLADDLRMLLAQTLTDVAIGDIFEYRRSMSKPVRAVFVSDFINVNSPDHLLLAGLYVAIEAHHDNPELCEAFRKAASLLRSAM
jgi:dTDP-glucose pyrophosphorylase